MLHWDRPAQPVSAQAPHARNVAEHGDATLHDLQRISDIDWQVKFQSYVVHPVERR